MQLLASDHAGKCLSKEYWDMDTKLAWMCAKGHTWDATPLLVKRGGWCPQCYAGNQKEKFLEGFVCFLPFITNSINDFLNI